MGEDKSTGREGTDVHLFHLIPLAHSMLTQVSLRSHILGWTLGTRQRAKIAELHANAVYSLGENRHYPNGVGLRSARKQQGLTQAFGG